MRKYFISLLIILLLGFFFLLIFKPGQQKHTQESHINKTKTTQATAIKHSLYQKQSAKICGMLTSAVDLYTKTQHKKAYDLAESAYWDVYDNILEIKYRSYGTPQEIFSVENNFHAFSKSLKIANSDAHLKKINSAKTDLCKTIKKQADILDQHAKR
jgi:hypothetical protein